MGIRSWGSLSVFSLVLNLITMPSAAMSCTQVQLQLKEMQKAQAILLQSMAKKNESLAGTLDQYADELKAHDRRSLDAESFSMRKSAEAFRGHGAREQALIARFQDKSSELIAEAVQCLSQNTTDPASVSATAAATDIK